MTLQNSLKADLKLWKESLSRLSAFIRHTIYSLSYLFQGSFTFVIGWFYVSFLHPPSPTIQQEHSHQLYNTLYKYPKSQVMNKRMYLLNFGQQYNFKFTVQSSFLISIRKCASFSSIVLSFKSNVLENLEFSFNCPIPGFLKDLVICVYK